MIDRERLLADLQNLVRRLEDEVRERCDDQPEIDAPVRAEYERARAAKRTSNAYAVWRGEYLTQVAVAWVLAGVFVRFLEDNDLVDAPRLAGPGPRLGIARDHHTEWFSKHPTETDREYLRFVFSDAARLPALGRILGEAHNPLFTLGLSADGARELLEFWQRIDPSSGALVHDFTDPALSTRFLGDLYQDLSESARKTYALLQTPHFVEGSFSTAPSSRPSRSSATRPSASSIPPAAPATCSLALRPAFRALVTRRARYQFARAGAAHPRCDPQRRGSRDRGPHG